MKRNLLFIALFLAFTLVLTGCSQKSTSQFSGLQNNALTTSKATGRNTRMPDFGQPERQADIRGVVTSIVGNEATVLKIAVNQNRRASSTDESSGGGASSSGPGASGAPALSLGGVVSGDAGGHANRQGGQDGPGGFGGPGGGQGRGAGATDRATMIANLKAMSTGQEKIVIPVGIKMMKFETDIDGKRTTVEASLSDITSDKMITVWLNTTVADKKVADFVLIN